MRNTSGRRCNAGKVLLGFIGVFLSGLLPLVGGSAAMASGRVLPQPAVDEDYYENGRPAAAKVDLGRLLFYDKVLSGNRNISCATCHHPQLAGGDGVALALGEGAEGLGRDRTAGNSEGTGVHGRVPRNSPALFNLGAREFRRMYHDGRVELDGDGVFRSGFFSPAKWELPPGLDNVLAAQSMFPFLSALEMAGQVGENEVANALYRELPDDRAVAWDLLASRLASIPQYVELFRLAFPERISVGADIRLVDAANAIAAYEATEIRSKDSPFDQYLQGEERALSSSQRDGMALFYGRAGCSTCHSGTFQTDHEFHAIAMPQIGPGKGHGYNAAYWQSTGLWAYIEDHGRGGVTGDDAEDYSFRTPSLRNVTATGPWGHVGSFDSLEAVVRHHLDPIQSLASYRLESGLLVDLGSIQELGFEGDQVESSKMDAGRQDRFLQRDGFIQQSPRLRRRIANANQLEPIKLNDTEVNQILAFLESLTDEAGLARLERSIPRAVPSGLPVDRMPTPQASL